MSHSIIDSIFTGLIKQLVYFDENSTVLLDYYYLEFTRERKETEQFISNYRERLEHIVGNFRMDMPQSIVLIGSRVTVLNTMDGLYESYTIVLPEHSDMDQYYISCFSPIGRQLLLTNIGETITALTPTGSYDLTISKIEFIVY